MSLNPKPQIVVSIFFYRGQIEAQGATATPLGRVSRPGGPTEGPVPLSIGIIIS